MFLKTILSVAMATALTAPAIAQTKSAGKPASAQAVAPNTAEFDRQMAQAQAQENMRQMQAQMDRMRSTQDPQERQKLLQEHWAGMQAAMTAMHAMWGLGATWAAAWAAPAR